MALDEPKDTDHVFDIDGFKYIVDKEFMEKIKPIKIDFSVMGFKLDCGIDFGSAGSECSSCGTKTNSCC
jgi:Fe-S cluster assembly iron-binding protein IscA